MFYMITDRETLIGHLPPGGVGAEIGVAQGDFAAVILAKAQPKQLHLIDPWSHLEADVKDGAEHLSRLEKGDAPPVPANAEGDKQHDAIVARFAADKRVVVHRQYSYRAVSAFADKSLDFVYIDGNHAYEYVLRDLHDFAAKVKDDGLILGHDFFEDEFAAKNGYGVIDAVNAFLKRTGYIFLALTWEPFSTYVIAKRNEGFARAFMGRCLESSVGMIEIPAASAFNYIDKAYKRRDGSQRRIPSFAR
jgi:hypothetical protein